MTEDNNRNNISNIALPEHVDYPFFAYGFFKSDELAYYKIKRFVDGKPKIAMVKGLLYEKDGLPIITNKNQDGEYGFYSIEGELISFNNWEKAYKEICNIEPGQLYCWDIIDVYVDNKERQANILVAKDNLLSKEKEVSGAIKLKHPDDQIVHDRGIAWRGYRDTLFVKGMEFLETEYFKKPQRLRFIKPCTKEQLERSLHNLFSLQMAYAFLWTIIERHNTIKYRVNSEKIYKKLEAMAQDTFYREAIDKIEDGFVFNYPGIYSNNSGDLSSFNGNPKNSIDGYYKKIEMYYQVRCNVVHRGKAGLDTTDFPKLRGAFLDMFAIMQYMLRKELKKRFDIEHMTEDHEYTEKEMEEGIEKLKEYKQIFKERNNNG